MTNDATDLILRVVAGGDLGGLFSLHRQRLIVGRVLKIGDELQIGKTALRYERA